MQRDLRIRPVDPAVKVLIRVFSEELFQGLRCLLEGAGPGGADEGDFVPVDAPDELGAWQWDEVQFVDEFFS
jgi:hypothetical protein